MKIKDFTIEQFGPLENISGTQLENINLFLGKNGVGKTFLLKALYAIIRSQEEYKKGDDRREFDEVLSDKLYWTFQVEKLNELVQKGNGNRLKASLTSNEARTLYFEIGGDTNKKITTIKNNLPSREANSVFLPPKEVLTLSKVILKSGLQDKTFGFDATYVDLVIALQNPTQKGRTFESFKASRVSLEKMFQGRIEYDTKSDRWIYKKGNARFSINTTAEGVKKIAILDTLLGNRFLTPDSIVFIDEPESALHPTAISQLLEIVSILAEKGIQFFIATHSYFVIKNLYLIARKKDINIPIFLTKEKETWFQENLKNGIPDNEIVKESIRLFDEELEMGLNG
jgi:predicted ATPase